MKHALMVTITCDTNQRRDDLEPAIRNRVFGKPLWAGQPTLIMKDSDPKINKPILGIEARFENEADMVDMLGYLKGLENRPYIEVKGSTHLCGHDEGKSCDNGSWKEL